MADTKLSALTALAVEPADSDELYINDGGTSKRITYGTLKTELLNRANHTGTDSTSLISSLTEVTVAAGDYIMVLDVSTSPVSLKKILASDFATAAQANATHTGDVTGATALSIQPVAISGQALATASGSDYVLILDTSDSPNTLKKALCSDLGSAFGVTDITGAGAITVAGTDLLVAVDVSASPQVLGQVTAQAVADLFDASGYLPLSGGELTGDITFAAASPEHTVDGRNISADGAKLDGIEAGADVTDTANVTAAGALMDSELADITAIKTLQAPDNTTISTFGASLVDDADAATARTTLDVDQAGTDNSTDVTLAGSLDYLTITGQQITRNAIDLATDVTGNLPAVNLDASAITGQAADSPMAAAAGDLLLIADVSVSPISLKQVTAQSIADLGGGGSSSAADLTWASGTQSEKADGATTNAFEFDTDNALATSGANLVRLKNNGTTVFDFSYQGGIDHVNSGASTAAHSQSLNLNWSASSTQTSSGQNSAVIGASNTASGSHSLAGGQASTASGDWAFAWGYLNQATANQSIALGSRAVASTRTMLAIGADRFSSNGDAQVQTIPLRIATSNATQTTMQVIGLFDLVIPSDTSWAFSALVIGRSDEADGNDSAAYKLEGLLARDESSNTALVGSVTKTVIAESAGATAWDATAEADDTNEALAIKVTGEASTNIRWVAKVDIAQVTYA